LRSFELLSGTTLFGEFVMTVNRIDPTPARLSTNFTVGRQSQGATFGERMQAGLAQAGNIIGQGAALVGGALPGGSILSAAVSSVTNLSSQGGSTGAAGFASTGVVNVGGGINTTVSSTGGTVAVGSGTANPNLTAGGSTNNVGTMNSEIMAASQENSKLLQVQIAMQRENQVFTSVSNVLKTKHDTVKNSISNVR
jgi:hypothetical protein